MPNQPATPNRNVRIDDDLWDDLQAIANELGITRSELVRRVLRAYVRRYPG